MFMCTGMFLPKTAYGYGKRAFVRRSGDCVVYTYQFHVPCGSCKHVLYFLFPLLQAAREGDPKWNQFAVSLSCALSPHGIKNNYTNCHRAKSVIA